VVFFTSHCIWSLSESSLMFYILTQRNYMLKSTCLSFLRWPEYKVFEY
jgi:hypothetical protein